MSFLDEMEKSEQERPRSATLGSHRAVSPAPPAIRAPLRSLTPPSLTPPPPQLSEEELPCMEPAPAEVSGALTRLRLELEDKKRSVGMLQAALVGGETQRRRRGGFPLRRRG